MTTRTKPFVDSATTSTKSSTQGTEAPSSEPADSQDASAATARPYPADFDTPKEGEGLSPLPHQRLLPSPSQSHVDKFIESKTDDKVAAISFYGSLTEFETKNDFIQKCLSVGPLYDRKIGEFGST